MTFLETLEMAYTNLLAKVVTELKEEYKKVTLTTKLKIFKTCR